MATSKTPRSPVWPVVVAYLSMWAANIGVGIGVAVFVTIRATTGGAAPDDLEAKIEAFFRTPAVLSWMAAGSAVVLAALALLFARFYGAPLTKTLRLHRPAVPAWVVVGGALSAFFFCLGTSHLWSFAFGDPSDHLHNMQSAAHSSGVNYWVFTLAVVVLAPIAEELFFRGLAQGRLAARFGPVAAIVVSAFAFGLMHADPQQIVMTSFMGLAFGVVAYRTRSVISAIAAHMLNNAFFIVVNLFEFGDDDASSPMVVYGAAYTALSLIGFGLFLFGSRSGGGVRANDAR